MWCSKPHPASTVYLREPLRVRSHKGDHEEGLGLQKLFHLQAESQ